MDSTVLSAVFLFILLQQELVFALVFALEHEVILLLSQEDILVLSHETLVAHSFAVAVVLAFWLVEHFDISAHFLSLVQGCPAITLGTIRKDITIKPAKINLNFLINYLRFFDKSRY